MTDRNRAWRRKQARKVVARIEDTKKWLLKTVQRRKGEKPVPVPGAKEHAHGKLTKLQHMKQVAATKFEIRSGFDLQDGLAA